MSVRPPAVDRDARDAIVELEYAYAACLDDDRLEDWPGLFVEDGVYDIQTRENREDGYPLGVFTCRNRAQMRDRVKILRNAAVFSLRYYRRVVGNVRVLGVGPDGAYAVAASYICCATDILDGTTTVFSAGAYADTVVFADGAARFREKVVIADTASIPGNLSVPL